MPEFKSTTLSNGLRIAAEIDSRSYSMAIGYFVLVLLYGAIVLTSDWQHYAELAVERAEMNK